MTEVWLLTLPNSHDPGGEVVSVHASLEVARAAAQAYMAADTERWGRPWEERGPDAWGCDSTTLEIERHEVKP